ncbi:Endochitinase 1 [Blomia tropicalis]|nr:Endochitinase 1 [Blomia tropicalis]
MKLCLTIFSIVVALATTLVIAKDRNNKQFKVVCYFASWTSDASGENRFTPEDIDANLCTHVNFAFGKLVNNRLVVENGDDLIRRVNNLRQKNPHLSTLISIGGWSDGSTKYSQIVRSDSSRKVFIQSAIDFLAKHDLDGLDFDWEFPGFNGDEGGDRQLGRPEDKVDYVTLLRELRQAFAPHQFLLTAALTTAKYNMDHAYIVKGVSDNLDFLNLMTYDFHGTWNKKIGYVSPLSAASHWSEEDRMLTVQYTVDYFIQNGADPRKLIIGVPFYGYGYVSDQKPMVGANVVRSFDAGTYAHICLMVKHDTAWKFSLIMKPKRLNMIKSRNLGGAMIWEVNGDDHRGQCDAGKFPLLSKIMNTLN